MNRQEVVKITFVFVLLFVAGLGMVVGAYRWAPADTQGVLISVGSAILGGTLGFFLVEMFEIERTFRR